MSERDEDDRIPELGAAEWESIARPIWRFLATPRTVESIERDARARGVCLDITRQALAWLDLQGRARWDAEARLWHRDRRAPAFSAAEHEPPNPFPSLGAIVGFVRD